MTDEMTRVSRQISRIADPYMMRIGVACLVQIYGKEIGKKFPLNADNVTIGRGPDNHIVIDMDNVSRLHACVKSDQQYYYVEDMGSTNGTFLNDFEIEKVQKLNNGDFVKIGGVIFKYLDGNNIEQLYYEEIYKMAIIDGLTQIYNKRYFMEFLERELSRCKRYSRPLSLLLFDLDHFKRVNDEFGHLAGDYVLKHLSDCISMNNIRKEECFARYGGEEFAIILPDTSERNAYLLGERIRALIDKTKFVFEDNEMPISISMGIAHYSGSELPEELIAVADEKLYKAKERGRNCVVV